MGDRTLILSPNSTNVNAFEPQNLVLLEGNYATVPSNDFQPHDFFAL